MKMRNSKRPMDRTIEPLPPPSGDESSPISSVIVEAPLHMIIPARTPRLAVDVAGSGAFFVCERTISRRARTSKLSDAAEQLIPIVGYARYIVFTILVQAIAWRCAPLARGESCWIFSTLQL